MLSIEVIIVRNGNWHLFFRQLFEWYYPFVFQFYIHFIFNSFMAFPLMNNEYLPDPRKSCQFCLSSLQVTDQLVTVSVECFKIQRDLFKKVLIAVQKAIQLSMGTLFLLISLPNSSPRSQNVFYVLEKCIQFIMPGL